MLAQLATKIDSRVKKVMEEVCKGRGLKMSRFIEDALLDKLEELEDVEDLQSLRQETTKPFAQVLKELRACGKI